MNYQGDYDVGANIYVWFNTFDSNDPSASVTMTDFINTDVHIHKDDSLTQRNNAAGVTVDVDVDGIAGVHKITIDTADNTVADFFEAGHDYAVRIEGVTVDAAALNPVVGTFSIANRRVAGQMCVSSIEGLTTQSAFTLTTGEASANDDAYNGCTIIVTDQVTKIQKAIGHISDYTGATRAITLHAVPLQTAFTMAIGDSVEIIATSAFANVNTITQQTQTANDNGADINTLITQVGTAGDGLTAINLPNQTMDIVGDVTGNLSGSVGSVTGAVGSVTGAVGSVTGHTNQTGDNFAIVNGAAGLVAINTDVEAILVDTGTTIPGTITTAQNDLDTITGTAGALIATDAQDLSGSLDVNTKTITANAITAAAINTGAVAADAVAATALDNVVMSDLAQQAPSSTASIVVAMNWLYEAWRNKTLTTATLITLRNDADSADVCKATISDDATTFTKAEFITGA